MASAPPALPLPPPRHPFLAWPVPAATWYRVHDFDVATKRFGPTQFNDTDKGDARFSPLTDPTTGHVIPTLYAGATPAAAIGEVVLREIPNPSTGYLHDWASDKASALHLSAIGLRQLHLVDLKSQGLQAAGLEVAELFGTNQPDYPRTRAWALHIWQSMPHAHGLMWMSRRVNTDAALMLFGDRVAASALAVVTPPMPIAHYETVVLSMLDRLGCGTLG